MVNQDSDDYELMPSHELDDLRHEVSILKKGSLTDGDKAKALIESVDRLTISVNRLITILDDAQKDIIEEYQESKPAEKLNQLLEQNETIAKALLAISENLGSKNNTSSQQMPNQETFAMPPQNAPMNIQKGMFPSQQSNMMQQPNPMQMQNINRPGGPIPQQYNNMGGPQQNPFQMNNAPLMDDLPPLDSMPPLDNPAPAQKKKFLGIM